MAKWLKKAFLIFGVTFIALFLFRLAYGYIKTPVAETQLAEVNLSGFQLSRNNYASAKLKVKGDRINQGLNVDQKYEKIASLNSVSNTFNRDEKRLRHLIKEHQALIQFEENNGLKGSRQLMIGIGVHPARFDTFVHKIRAVGKIHSIEINKYDKTNEFKDLLAKKASLETAQEALSSLKNKGGKIEEYIRLENRLLEIEEQIQGFGIKLGEFDEENEFCTVKFALVEGIYNGHIPLIQRIMVALEWTIKYYLMLICILFIISLMTLVLLAMVEKIRSLIPSMERKITKEI